MQQLKVFKICQQIAKLSDNDIDEMQAEINSQIQYCSPLKMGTQKRVNDAGKNNMAILEAMKTLRLLILKGKPENGK